MAEEIKISELSQTENVNDEDIIMIVQRNANKKVTKANLFKETNDKIDEKILETNNKITNANTYSTEEINTGEKWIDGKTIYRKVIVERELSTASRVVYKTIAENIDTAWLDGGFAYYNNNKYCYPLDSNIGATIQVSGSNNQLVIINDNGNQRTMDFYVIVKYTKQEA